MSTAIYRYEVPVDDQWHEFTLHGDPLHVACREARVVEFWARAFDDGSTGLRRRFMVVGTGHAYASLLRYWGTAVWRGAGPLDVGSLVWHLLEER